jgi:cytochrome c biogenesis protein CcdA
MIPVIVLVLLLALLGGLGFAVHVLWYVLVFAVLLWLIGFFVGHAEQGFSSGRRHRWYGRW